MNGIHRSVRILGRICCLGKRNYLSEAYKCQEAWERRLNSHILKKINIDEMYHELDQAFQTNGRASVIDVDIFSNSIVHEAYADELEDVIHKFRLSTNTSDMVPSTPHAVIRSFMKMGRHDVLMRILNDRLNYGIFPDYYCSNLMFDTLLKRGCYRDAARVATFQMLQEDWDHPITAHFGLYACHMYLKHKADELWEPDMPEEPVEEVKVRVKYIRNPFFDDHFDLKDTNHLIGKTFVILSKSLPEDDPVRKTYELIGWTMYEKLDKAKSLLEKISSREEEFILCEGVQLLEEVFLGEDKNQPKAEVQEFLKSLRSLPTSKLHEEPGLLSEMETKLKKVISEYENKDIVQQLELYKTWEEQRQHMLNDQIALFHKEMVLKKVEEKKKEMAEKEELLTFFDKKDELEIMIEKNEELKRSEIKPKKKKKDTDEDYIPPDVK